MKDWIDYWRQDQFWKDCELWRINAAFFLKKAAPYLKLKPEDTVLNIGCGPGYLEKLLAPRVHSIHAVDIAQHYLEDCRKNTIGYTNVTTELLSDRYTDLSRIPNDYSVVLCISTVQYYKNLAEVEALILSVKNRSRPGTRMLIADLPLKRNRPGYLWDLVCSLVQGVREGYVGVLIKTAASLLRDDHYRPFVKQTRNLLFTRHDIQGLVKKLDLDAQYITESLSVYANRPSLLIQF